MVARLCEHNDRTCLPDPWMSVILMKKKEHAAVCSMGVLNLLSHQRLFRLPAWQCWYFHLRHGDEHQEFSSGVDSLTYNPHDLLFFLLFPPSSLSKVKTQTCFRLLLKAANAANQFVIYHPPAGY